MATMLLVIKIVFFSFAALTAITLTLISQIPSLEIIQEETSPAIVTEPSAADQYTVAALHSTKRVSRFLAADQKEKNDPRAADHCKQDNAICYLQGTNATTCCNNKCIDLRNDNENCGACKKKCKGFTQTCCRGECVWLSYDKRHCGACNSPCKNGRLCVYGQCDYA